MHAFYLKKKFTFVYVYLFIIIEVIITSNYVRELHKTRNLSCKYKIVA